MMVRLLLHSFKEPAIFLRDQTCFLEGPRPFIIETSEILSDAGHVFLKVEADDILVFPHEVARGRNDRRDQGIAEQRCRITLCR